MISDLDIDAAQAKVDQLSRDYLVENGWRWTSTGTPNGYWLWQKILDDGRTIMLDTELALLQTAAERLEAEEAET